MKLPSNTNSHWWLSNQYSICISHLFIQEQIERCVRTEILLLLELAFNIQAIHLAHNCRAPNLRAISYHLGHTQAVLKYIRTHSQHLCLLKYYSNTFTNHHCQNVTRGCKSRVHPNSHYRTVLQYICSIIDLKSIWKSKHYYNYSFHMTQKKKKPPPKNRDASLNWVSLKQKRSLTGLMSLLQAKGAELPKKAVCLHTFFH